MIEQSILAPHVGWSLTALLGLGWVVLGYLWGKKSKTLDDYMLAGRNVGLALGAATAMATWVTSNTTMLAPQLALELGVWGMLAYSSACIGLIIFAPLARRIKALMPLGYTSGDFVRIRYGRLPWICFLVISLFYSLTWLVSMGMAAGILLESLAGIPYAVGMTVLISVCVLYTVFGGLYAVIGTDFIQSLIILAGVILVGIVVLNTVDLGVTYAELETQRPALLAVLLPAALISFFNNMLFGMGEVTHSNVWWSRALAMKQGVGSKAFLLAGLMWLPVPIAAGFIALSSGALGVAVTSPDMVGPVVAATVLGSVGGVIVFVVVFCSLASSIDSLLAATSDLITEDIYRGVINTEATDHQVRKMLVWVTIGLGVFCWALSMPRLGTLATVLFFAGPLVASTLWPLLCGLYLQNASKRGAAWAMVLGSAAGLVSYFSIGWYTGALVGAAVSMAITVASLYVWPDDFDFNELRGR